MDSTEPDVRRGFIAEFLAFEAERLGLGIALIGGEGVNFWVQPRFTQDFDLTVSANAEAVWALVDALKAQGYLIAVADDADSPSGPALVRLKHPEGHPPIDIITAKTDYQNLVIERATPRQRGVLPVATPEDLIVLKLIANRSIDHRDIYTILETQSIDWEYVEHWARIWDVTDSLQRVREDWDRRPNR